MHVHLLPEILSCQSCTGFLRQFADLLLQFTQLLLMFFQLLVRCELVFLNLLSNIAESVLVSGIGGTVPLEEADVVVIGDFEPLLALQATFVLYV